LPIEFLLTIGARAANCAADRDHCTLTRGFQTFQPDPGTRDYVHVTQTDGQTELDFLCLVCRGNLQVLIIVVAPAGVTEAVVMKNTRRPFLKNLLTGEYDQTVTLIPLGDGREVNIAVLLADT